MKFITWIIIAGVLLVAGCGGEKAALGTEGNPIKMYFVPSMEAGRVITGANAIAELLEAETGLHFKVGVPTSYAAVIEAMNTGETDVAWLATFAYVLANQKYNAQVGLTVVRNGLKEYKGEFVARADSGIESIEDIAGKVVAYTDAASTSGHIYPSALLKQKGIEPAKFFFTGGHPQAVIAVYEGNADVGCTYWSPPKDGEPQDARLHVLETRPDVMEKVVPIGFTDWIPNDTVTFRVDFPEEMKQQIVQALLKIAEDEKGHEILKTLYEIDGFVPADDSDYDVVRNTLETLQLSAESFIK